MVPTGPSPKLPWVPAAFHAMELGTTIGRPVLSTWERNQPQRRGCMKTLVAGAWRFEATCCTASASFGQASATVGLASV